VVWPLYSIFKRAAQWRLCGYLRQSGPRCYDDVGRLYRIIAGFCPTRISRQFGRLPDSDTFRSPGSGNITAGPATSGTGGYADRRAHFLVGAPCLWPNGGAAGSAAVGARPVLAGTDPYSGTRWAGDALYVAVATGIPASDAANNEHQCRLSVRFRSAGGGWLF
jgi:hypothetical protein